VESLIKVCNIMVQSTSTTVQSQHRFIGIKNIKYQATSMDIVV